MAKWCGDERPVERRRRRGLWSDARAWLGWIWRSIAGPGDPCDRCGEQSYMTWQGERLCTGCIERMIDE